MKWTACSVELPPIGVRVLCWVPDSNLFGDCREMVHIFLYRRELLPDPVFCDNGNHRLPFQYVCENRGWEFGHKVTHWAFVEPLIETEITA